MNERPHTDDEAAVPPDSVPASDPKATPGQSRPTRGRGKGGRGTPANNVVVTPLDEDKHIEDGIEIDEK